MGECSHLQHIRLLRSGEQRIVESIASYIISAVPFHDNALVHSIGANTTENENCAGSDTFGYILSAKPLKVKDYRKYAQEEYGKEEGNYCVDAMLEGTKLTDNSPLDKLVVN